MQFSYSFVEPSLGFNLATLGLPLSLVNQLDPKLTTLPSITIDQYQGLGGGGVSYQGQTFPTFSGTFSHLFGNHSMSYGVESRIYLKSNDPLGNVSPAYIFNSNYTLGPFDSSAAAPIVQGLASFLLGVPTGGSIDRNTSFVEASKYLAWFVQDNWKVNRSLTLNLGLRHEIEFPTTERYNRQTRSPRALPKHFTHP